MTRTTFVVVAKRWKRGWELHIDGVGVTQSKTLLDAEAMARDYISLVRDVPDDSFDLNVTPEIGAGVDGELLDLRNADREADAAQERARDQRRKVARRLESIGLSGREIATVLKISPQRVSQILGRAKKAQGVEGRKRVSS